MDADEVAKRLQHLREQYTSELPGKFEAIRAAWERLEAAWGAENLKTIIRLSHNLAGSGATFGFPLLSAAARDLENRLRQCEGAAAPSAAELDALRAAVRALIAAGGAGMEQAAAKPLVLRAKSPFQATGENRFIYIVDDDTATAEQLALQLRRYGYEIDVFSSPAAALAAVAAKPPAAVLMDIIFPEGRLAGVEVVAAIQRARQHPLPVMFMSSRDDLEARLHAVRNGGIAYLTKPVDAGALVDKLDDLLAPSPTEHYRVLVVDDSPQLAAYYAEILRDAGMEVEAVSDTTAIIDLLKQFRPDLILLDLYMPGCDGLELAAVIRQQEEWVSTAIVFLSAETDLDIQMDALRRGGDDFLIKPVEPHHLAAAVTAHVRRARELRSYMVRDGLTGLLNHSAIKEQLGLELARCLRENRPLSFAMLDIDHFKQVNDRYGHAAGDRVITNLSRLLRDRLRASDMVGRYGGEEFAMVLIGAGAEDARRLLEAIREDFAAMRHASEQGEFSVSFSAGIAAFAGHADAADLNECADKALYEAKRAGRNRIIVAGVS